MAHLANSYGNAQITLDATNLATAPPNGTSITVDVALGLPLNVAVWDMLSALGIDRASGVNANQRPVHKLRGGNPTADFPMEFTFAQVGVREGDTILIDEI